MNKNDFIKQVKLLDIDIDDKKIEMLEKYFNLLIEWNQKINLTAITLEEDVYLKHFYDSLTLTRIIDFDDIKTMCDVGTGAGFPGIVIKIFYPHIRLTLLDALNKRIVFLKEVVKELKLENVFFVHARAEEYGIINRGYYDLVVARAVAPLNILLEYCIPLTKNNKYFVAMKANEDISYSYNAMKELGCEVKELEVFRLPYEDSMRMLIKLIKTKKTPSKYPRRNDQIKKKPL